MTHMDAERNYYPVQSDNERQGAVDHTALFQHQSISLQLCSHSVPLPLLSGYIIPKIKCVWAVV